MTTRRRANRDPTSRAASPRRFEDGRAGSGSNHRAADLARGTRAAPLRPAHSRAVTQRVTCSPLARASTRLERRLLWPSAGGGWRGVAFRGYPRPAMQPCVFARACDAKSTSSASEPPTRPNPLRTLCAAADPRPNPASMCLACVLRHWKLRNHGGEKFKLEVTNQKPQEVRRAHPTILNERVMSM